MERHTADLARSGELCVVGECRGLRLERNTTDHIHGVEAGGQGPVEERSGKEARVRPDLAGTSSEGVDNRT
jgi:hypothetical protein